MARYPNVRGRKDHRPRGQDRMWDEIAIAQRLYLETGGEDIDFGIRSARNMLETYDRQQESGAAGQGLITHAEANRARAQLANLTRQREQKLARCRADIDEMLDTDAKAKEETKPEPSTKPESRNTEAPEPLKPVAPRTADALEPVAAASD